MERGLRICSGFFADLEGANAREAGREGVIEKARSYARFLKASGADIMVIGAPLRQTLGAQPTRFHDLESAGRLADDLNHLGAALHGEGVRLQFTRKHIRFSHLHVMWIC